MAAGLSRFWNQNRIWALYIAGLIPAIWFFYLGTSGQIPGNAIKEFERFLGLWALRFLLLTLLVTPLRDLASVNLLRYRRALGLLAFWYVILHFTVYMVLDQRLQFKVVIKDITDRPFITIGMAAFIFLIPLAMTSNAFSIRKLGARWIKLHKLSYLIVLGGALHFIMARKVVTAEPLIYMAFAALLVVYRLFRPRVLRWRKQRRLASAAR